ARASPSKFVFAATVLHSVKPRNSKRCWRHFVTRYKKTPNLNRVVRSCSSIVTNEPAANSNWEMIGGHSCTTTCCNHCMRSLSRKMLRSRIEHIEHIDTTYYIVS